MRWLALCDADGPFGTGSVSDRADGLLDCGSLVAEFTLSARSGPPLMLMDYADERGWPRQLSIAQTAEGSITLLHRQADSIATAAVSLPLPAEATMLRLTYSWDARRRLSQLAAELPALGRLAVVRGSNPLPLPMDDMAAIAGGAGRFGGQLAWLGFTNAIERIGHVPGVIGATLVRTPAGMKRLDSLRPGDLVATREHGALPLRWIGGIEMPARGSFAPVRLRAPFFGNRSDLVVSVNQKVMLSGAEVEYLFGEDEVTVEAGRLVDGRTALAERRRSLVRFYSVLLDHHALLDADGGGVESLFVAANRSDQSPEYGWLRDSLKPVALPSHPHPALLALRGYEAVTLLAMRRQGCNPVAA